MILSTKMELKMNKEQAITYIESLISDLEKERSDFSKGRVHGFMSACLAMGLITFTEHDSFSSRIYEV